ncbi:MAG: UvrD-helicase domain-containing protein, partial [Vicinamibacteria bacterium]|nr:UvrD-helicase domain-containing protein [Vicinamibacteria bacterium]
MTAERKTLRGLARALADHRDLTPLVAKTPIDARRWRSELEDKTQRARALLSGVDEGDTLAHALRELLAFAATTRDLEGEALIERLVKMPMIPKRRGRKDCWPSEARLEDARALALWTQERCAQWQADQGARLYSRLAETLQGVGRRYAAIKQAAGVLDFLDLLIETERALKTRASLRQAFSQRYRIVIVDEFQDTDPIQVEIVRLIAGTHPGGLVIVGDAKQSIYRFRRAEVALFHRLAEEMRARPQSAVVHLTRNFRSRPALLRFVNRVFAELIQESEELGQPAYEPITPAPSIEDAPALIAVEFEAPAAKGRDLVEKEARALAHCLRAAANGCLQVRDPATQNPRASRASDVMVLARRLSHVEVLEQALDAAKIRFVLLGGKSFFDRQEVRETLHLLKAIADPTDRYALTAALRSICLGVSDADLVAYALAGGELRVGALDPNLPGAKALAPALELIERLHARREVDSIALLIERLFEETRMRALLTCSPRGEAQIANLEQVVMLARRLDGTSVLSLRGFIALLEQRVREGCQEADWPATRLDDPDTVRILTIHRAKGLEAPIVALFDSADEGTPKVDVVALRDSGQVALGFRADCAPPDWEALKEQEEARLKAEMHRLQYVACTRARDFLILPRPQGGAEVGDFLGELVQALPRQPAADIIEHVASLADEYGGHETPASDEEAAPVDTRVWEDTRRELIAQAGYQAYRPIAATQYARAQSVEQTVLSRSADTTGLEYGSLVHAVLEWIPFANVDEREIAKLTAALAPRHGLPPAAAARAANEIAAVLRLPIVAQAAHAQRVYRELPIALPEDGQLIEGVVDLVFEDNGRWIVIDYKTD